MGQTTSYPDMFEISFTAEHLSLTMSIIERDVIQTEEWCWRMLAPNRRVLISFVILLRTGHFQNCVTHGHLIAGWAACLWLHGYPIRISDIHWLNPSAKICLSCQLFFCCPIWWFLAWFWSHIIFASLPFWIVLFNLHSVLNNQQRTRRISACLRLSQSFSLAHPHFSPLQSPRLGTPAPAAQHWDVGGEQPENHGEFHVFFFLWYRQCHKPTMTGDGGGFVKETLWLGIMIYDMGCTTLIYHKSIWKHMKAMKNQESVVFFSAYLLETREMGISSAKVEKYFFTMKHRDFTSKTLTRREKGWKRRCVARGLAVAYTVPQNAPKFFEGTWKNIQSLYFANTC